MKKIILVISFTFLTISICYAAGPFDIATPAVMIDVDDPDEMIGVSGVAGGGSCTATIAGGADNDEVGNITDVEANNRTYNNNDSACVLHTPDCDGTLEIGYIWHQNTDSVDIKIAVYNDNGSSPGSPDTTDSKIVVSSNITSTAQEWMDTTTAIGGAVAPGGNVWVCVFVADASSNFRGRGNTTGSVWADGGETDHYASPPDNLGDTWSEIASTGPLSFFVGIE